MDYVKKKKKATEPWAEMLHLKSINSFFVETIWLLLRIIHAQYIGKEEAACNSIISKVL